MSYKHLLILLLVLPPLLFSSCDERGDEGSIAFFFDKTPGLPPITMEGKRTFGFLLDGEEWGHKPTLFIRNYIGDYSEASKSFEIKVRVTNGDKYANLRLAADFDSVGVYDLTSIGYSQSGVSYLGEESLLEEEASYIAITRLDVVDSIVAGLFQFTMIDPLYGDTIRFTQGRFDYKWQR